MTYINQINKAKSIFDSKYKEYGNSYSLFRNISMMEQIEIKIKRIINIQNGMEMKVKGVGDDIESEYLGVYNYCIQYILNNSNLDYETVSNDIYNLMLQKDHDYGSAWKTMHLWSLTDLMNVKLQRVKNMILKQMENKDIDNTVTEGIISNVQDLANYSIFCLIKL